MYFEAKSKNFDYNNYKKNSFQDLYYITSTDLAGMYSYSDAYSSSIKNDKICFKINSIPAQDIDKVFLLNVTAYSSESKIMFPYSPMTYIFKGVNSSDKNLSNLCKAMYWYWDAAEKYTK